jgi:hypothetical protein
VHARQKTAELTIWPLTTEGPRSEYESRYVTTVRLRIFPAGSLDSRSPFNTCLFELAAQSTEDGSWCGRGTNGGTSLLFSSLF